MFDIPTKADYDGFISSYGIRHRKSDYYVTSSFVEQYVDNYGNYRDTVEVEMPRSEFESLVNSYKRLGETSNSLGKRIQQEREELALRQQHPSLNELYEKYQMLLALYK
jgi:hypothetical protein